MYSTVHYCSFDPVYTVRNGFPFFSLKVMGRRKSVLILNQILQWQTTYHSRAGRATVLNIVPRDNATMWQCIKACYTMEKCELFGVKVKFEDNEAVMWNRRQLWAWKAEIRLSVRPALINWCFENTHTHSVHGSSHHRPSCLLRRA